MGIRTGNHNIFRFTKLNVVIIKDTQLTNKFIEHEMQHGLNTDSKNTLTLNMLVGKGVV